MAENDPANTGQLKSYARMYLTDVNNAMVAEFGQGLKGLLTSYSESDMESLGEAVRTSKLDKRRLKEAAERVVDDMDKLAKPSLWALTTGITDETASFDFSFFGAALSESVSDFGGIIDDTVEKTKTVVDDTVSKATTVATGVRDTTKYLSYGLIAIAAIYVITQIRSIKKMMGVIK